MPEKLNRLTARVLLEVRAPHSLRVSPDGCAAAFILDEPDFDESRWTSRIWLADLVNGEARQITFSYEGEVHPQFSPDGKWLAFLSTRPDFTLPPPASQEEEDEQAHRDQVWVMPLGGGGEAYRLTNLQGGIASFEWMPDAASVVCLAQESRAPAIKNAEDEARKRRVDPWVQGEDRRRMQLWEVMVDDRRCDLLYTGDAGLLEFAVSPDGKRIAFVTNRTGDPNDFHHTDLLVLTLDEEGEPVLVTDARGCKTQPTWSPESDTLWYVGPIDPDRAYSQVALWSVASTGGEPCRLIADKSFDIGGLCRTSTGGLALTAADKTRTPLLSLVGDVLQALTDLDFTGECLSFDVGPSGRIAAVLEDAERLPEVYSRDEDGTWRQITHFNDEVWTHYERPEQRVVSWSSEEFAIEGVLTLPSDGGSTKPLPLIVQVHGGPKYRAVNTLRAYTLHALWAANGYSVLQPNFRGSEGYGNAFATANYRDLGGGDLRDVIAGVDWAVATGIADPKRIGIMGGSYGGYLAASAVGQSDRFAAAISMFGMFNLASSSATSDLSRWEQEYLGASYWEDPEIYRQCSPSAHIERITSPMLIVHGDSDANTFISNSKELHHALKTRGVPVEFVTYPREGHGLREPNHRLDEARRWIEWFDRHIRGMDHRAARVGERIRHEGYELRVVRAEPFEPIGWGRDDPRLIEIACAIASENPVESGWTLSLDELRLTHGSGTSSAPVGVPMDMGGGRALLRGDGMALEALPDRETGRLWLTILAAFVIDESGGSYEFRVADFPPVGIDVPAAAPKERDEPNDESVATEPA